MKFRIVDILRFMFKPYGVVIFTVLMSFTSWALPDLGIFQKGYDKPQSLFSFGMLMAAAWYGIIIFLVWVGFHS